ncbi:MAG TPA: ATP-binding protein, partial [Kofleriaceae bacterium]
MYRSSNHDRSEPLARLVNALPAMIAYWDATLHCRYANRAYEKWFGVTAEAMLGRDMKEFLGPLFELNRPFIEGALRGVEQQFEREIPDPHGGPVRFSQAHYMPDVVDGVVRGFSVLVVDITQRRQAEQALTEMERKVHANERLAAVATLAAGTSHELNNPLAVVLANLDFGLEELDHGEVDLGELRGLLVEARDAAWRARDILRNMATLARGEVTSREPVDVAAAIETSLQLAAPAFRYKARLVREQVATPPVLANAAQLVQVLVNLLLNAAQALPDRAIELNEIRVATRHQDGQVIVEVRDNGAGIAAEHLERIFEPFFTTKAVGSGMGLGLSIALGIVRSFGGTLAVRSEPGAGAVFSLSLPAVAATVPVPVEPPPAVEVAPASGRYRVLIVDDEPLITRTLERALERELDVIAVNSAAEALAVLSRPDLEID